MSCKSKPRSLRLKTFDRKGTLFVGARIKSDGAVEIRLPDENSAAVHAAVTQEEAEDERIYQWRTRRQTSAASMFLLFTLILGSFIIGMIAYLILFYVFHFNNAPPRLESNEIESRRLEEMMQCRWMIMMMMKNNSLAFTDVPVISAPKWQRSTSLNCSAECLKNESSCIYARIWPVEGASSSPVLVFLGGTLDQLEAKRADLNSTIVHLPHRSGALGFLSPTGNASSLNAAFSDALAGLDWIQRYIQYYGGDPKQVTMIAEGNSASLLYALARAPASSKLLRQAILLLPWPHVTRTPQLDAAMRHVFLNSCRNWTVADEEETKQCSPSALTDPTSNWSSVVVWPSSDLPFPLEQCPRAGSPFVPLLVVTPLPDKSSAALQCWLNALVDLASACNSLAPIYHASMHVPASWRQLFNVVDRDPNTADLRSLVQRFMLDPLQMPWRQLPHASAIIQGSLQIVYKLTYQPCVVEEPK